MTFISLIITVFNEEQTIARLMDSLQAQSRLPDEIVIVDGGSTDNTYTMIKDYASCFPVPVHLIHKPGCNISQGRNMAIEAASGDIIAATDAGVHIPPNWLHHLIVPFEQNPDVRAVAGFFLPDPDLDSPFEVAMSATVLPALDEIQPDTFLPSSRSVAFRKEAWQQAGGYPEWLDYCEDLIFDLRLKMVAGVFAFAPNAVVYFKPRTSLASFFRQYYLYARGDGKADLWRKRHAIRYVTYLILAPMLLLLSMLIYPGFLMLFLVGGAIYIKQPVTRLRHLWSSLSPGGKLMVLAWLPVIRFTGDVAKMLGYPMGWQWRLQNHPPDWKK